jgi:predicted HNH restriction endonuclease
MKRKRKLKPITPRSRIVNSLRMLWLRSRERAEALKLQNRTCQRCGVKASAAKGKEQKIQVHHKTGIDVWSNIVTLIREELLVSPNKLECLCPECHKKTHKKENI